MAPVVGLAVQVALADGVPGAARSATVWPTHSAEKAAPDVEAAVPVAPALVRVASPTDAPPPPALPPDSTLHRWIVPAGEANASCRLPIDRTTLVLGSVVVTEGVVAVLPVPTSASWAFTGLLVSAPL